jgi:hypothetical protein
MWNIGPIHIQAILNIHKNIYKCESKSGTGRGDQVRRKRWKDSK